MHREEAGEKAALCRCRWSSPRGPFPQPPPSLRSRASLPRRCWREAPGARGLGGARARRPRLRLRASLMAEGRRREDDEEELRERRELGGPRRARGRALSGHSAAGEGARRRGREWAGRRAPADRESWALRDRPGPARAATAPSPVGMGPAPLTLEAESQGGESEPLHPHPHFRVEPEEIQKAFSTCQWPGRTETPKWACRTQSRR